MTASCVGALVALLGCTGRASEAEFNGTVLRNPEAAPQISLSNQFDQKVSLDSLGGQAVVLTFLYTNCPDVCPIITSQLRDVQSLLGIDAESVEFVAVSADPERDTVEAARDYLERWGLENDWQYLVGDRESLTPIWAGYYIDPYSEGESAAAGTPEPRGAVGGLSAAIHQRYLVIHSAPVFLIDRSGRRRIVFTSPFDAAEMAADIRALLESG